MKRLLTMCAVLSLVVAAAAFAKGTDDKAEHKAAGHSHSTMAAGAKTGSWTGEIIDAGCYLAHGASGSKHAECALKCASNGAPMMLLTKDGKVMLLSPNHDNPDPYNQLKGMAGSNAKVTGTMAERSGVKGIDVTGVEAVAAAVESK